MTGDAAKFLGLTLLLAACLLSAEAGPCHSRSEPAPAIVLAAGPGKYVIKAGDTVSLLALRFGVPTAAILRANPGLNPARLPLGKEISIPSPTKPGTETPAAPAATSPGQSGTTGPGLAATASPAPGGLELRPEKAPQATPPPAGGIKSHDLPDAPGKASQAGAPRDIGAVQTQKPATAVQPAAPVPPAAASEPEPARAPVAVQGPMAGWPVWSLAALAGALALAFVFQGMLGNLAAAVTLRLLRPFRRGDTVRLAGIVGRVESLGGWYVAIRSESGETVYVPNAKAAGEIVVVSREGRKQTPKVAPRRAD